MFFKMRSAYSVAAISAVLTVAAVASAKYKAGNPEILVHAKGPLGLRIDGKSHKLSIEEGEKSVTFRTFVNTIDTGNGMRNEHMQKRLGQILDITLTVPKDKADPKKSGSVGGLLNFHGVSKPVTVNYTVDGSHVNAKFSFNVFDHFPVNDKFSKDDQDKLLCNTGVCAKPGVDVEVNFDVKNE